jgi:hypothetical protein
MATSTRCRTCWVLPLLLACAAIVRADDPKVEAKGEPPRAKAADAPFDLNELDPEYVRRMYGSAIGLWSAPHGLELVNLYAANYAPWPRRHDRNDPFVDRDMLYGVEDRRELLPANQNAYEARAYHYLVLHARDVSPAALTRHARRDITFDELWLNPALYRGEIVHLEGRLRLLKRLDADYSLRKQGTPKVYEAWIYGPAFNSNPMCVRFTHLPQELEPFAGRTLGEHEPIVWVSTEAYFLKLMSYVAGGPQADVDPSKRHRRAAPLLIGKTLVRLPFEQAPETDIPRAFSDFFVPVAIAGIVGLFAVAAGLGWWFRKGDARVHSRLLQTRSSEFVEPSDNGDPPQGGE